tara:strand:+ start:2713 stop:3867 length:1155 start_codon:yes stop_codon:yes gene_type:complete
MKATDIENVDSTEFKSLMTPELLKLGKIFKQNNFDLRLVGGAVRDLMLDKIPKDIDLASDATPHQMQDMLINAGIKTVPTGIEHGTITAVLNGEPFEITTLRSDDKTDGRKAEVSFITNWKEDARRRDLTYNAMSIDFDGRLYDYFDGMNDLQNKVSKFVGDPEERIKEDYLRILRYFRFQSKIANPVWDDETIKAIKSNVLGLKKISVERVWQEISKMLMGSNLDSILNYMNQTGVAGAIGLTTNNKEQLDRITYDHPVIGLAVLVSDSNISDRWKMTRGEKDLLHFLVTNKNTRINQKTAEDMIIAGDDKAKLIALAQMQGQKQLADMLVGFQPPAFPVQGRDLLDKGMTSGPSVGIALDNLKSIWKDSDYKLSKEQLLDKL